ncbi:MAG: beta-ketoacyl-ACP synthase II [Planctomycetota bacterium]|nr:beta-ketoacyl-ACP synthase II [Planctomycetota bacterium]MCX8039312.1 beta-ketoacyl-ACP synthase II [Planctomycetota bacterium]MDW8372077.1 beta-ketoacyl-ACP synthase II [Planctomycetota bacterium]
MSQRRVVITGMGVVACNGTDVPSFWDALRQGRHGIRMITQFDASQHATRFAGEVPIDNLTLANGDRKMLRRKDRFVLLALKAAAEAMAMSGLPRTADGKVAWRDPFRVAVIVGAGIGGLATIEEEHRTMLERGPSRVSPLLVPKMIVDSLAGDISIVYGAKGPNYAIVTACATASHCIGAAFHHIRHGLCDAALCGGSEAPITHLGVAGFNAIGALSKRNDDPGAASRPFDKDRDGFVMAEGAGILVLESLEHAQARGARIIAEIVGYGCTGDAYHETAPDPSGAGGIACMRMALADAGLPPEAIGYINAHGTSTEFNDKTETAVIKQVFGPHAYKLAVSSTKSMTGHTLGAAGAVEAIATILALQHGVLPPTINLQHPDPECDLDYVPQQARPAAIEYALSNNLGFGGHNASLIFRRYRP